MLRTGAGLLAVLFWGLAGWSLYSRSWIGFPDGFVGPADRLSEVALSLIAVGSITLGVVSGYLALKPPARRRAVILASLGGLWVGLAAASLLVEPWLRSQFPSTGG